MPETAKLDRFISIALTIATLVAAGLLIEGRFRQSAGISSDVARVERFEDWQELSKAARAQVGDSTSPVSVAIFTDFECPFCRRTDSVLTHFDQSHPGVMSRSLIHLPLASHPRAYSAALAFECGARLGRGQAVYEILYKNPNLISAARWSDLATRAGLVDSAAFARCIETDTLNPRIVAGIGLAKRLGVNTTPTVVVNGWLISPSFPEKITRAIQLVADGKHPEK